MGEAKRRHHKGERSPIARKRNKQRLLGAGLAIVALIAVVLGVYWLSNPKLMKPSSLPTAEGRSAFPAEQDRLGVSIGEEDAPIVVREFADYQCPACAGFSSAIERLKAEYIDNGQVRLVFFDLPLRQHANAVPAAEAARCAEDQGAWWAMHKMLFDNQSDWSGATNPEDVFLGYAESQDLDTRRFRRCMTGDIHRDEIEESRNLARDLRVTSTPTVLVDNIPLTRTSWAQLSAIVDRELSDRDSGQ